MIPLKFHFKMEISLNFTWRESDKQTDKIKDESGERHKKRKKQKTDRYT